MTTQFRASRVSSRRSRRRRPRFVPVNQDIIRALREDADRREREAQRERRAEEEARLKRMPLSFFAEQAASLNMSLDEVVPRFGTNPGLAEQELEVDREVARLRGKQIETELQQEAQRQFEIERERESIRRKAQREQGELSAAEARIASPQQKIAQAQKEEETKARQTQGELEPLFGRGRPDAGPRQITPLLPEQRLTPEQQKQRIMHDVLGAAFGVTPVRENVAPTPTQRERRTVFGTLLGSEPLIPSIPHVTPGTREYVLGLPESTAAFAAVGLPGLLRGNRGRLAPFSMEARRQTTQEFRERFSGLERFGIETAITAPLPGIGFGGLPTRVAPRAVRFLKPPSGLGATVPSFARPEGFAAFERLSAAEASRAGGFRDVIVVDEIHTEGRRLTLRNTATARDFVTRGDVPGRRIILSADATATQIADAQREIAGGVFRPHRRLGHRLPREITEEEKRLNDLQTRLPILRQRAEGQSPRSTHVVNLREAEAEIRMLQERLGREAPPTQFTERVGLLPEAPDVVIERPMELSGLAQAQKLTAAGIRIMQPRSPKWIKAARRNPHLQSDMVDQAKRVSEGLPRDGPPGAYPPPTGTALDDSLQALSQFKDRVPRANVQEQLLTVKTRIFEELTDENARVVATSAKVRATWRKQFGEELPDALDAEMLLALNKGVAAGALQARVDTMRQVRNTLGQGISQDYVNEFMLSKRFIEIGQQLPDRTFPKGYDPATSQLKLDQMVESLGPEGFARVEAAAAHVRDLSRELLQMRVKSGMISQTFADSLEAMYPHYSPLRYAEFLDEFIDTGRGPMSTFSSGIQHLSEAGVDPSVMPVPPLREMFHAGIKAENQIQRNDIARSLVQMHLKHPDVAPFIKKTTAPPGARGNIIQYLDNGGKMQTYQVPEWLADFARKDALLPLDSHWFFGVGRFLNALPRGFITTYNPGFMAYNWIFDTLTVLQMQQVLPTRVIQALGKNLTALVKEDPMYTRMIKAGSDPLGWHGASATRMAEKIEKGRYEIKDIGSWRQLAKNPWDAVREIGHAIEMSPRRAVFEKALERGSTDKQAALLARRTTVDFQRAGRATRLANNFYLYLNPAVQGALMPIRAARDYPRARIGIAAFMGISVAAYAWNRQFPEYADVPLFDKLGKLIVQSPSGEINKFGNIVPHYFVLTPLREMAALHGSITYLLGQLDGKSPEDVDQFLKALVPLVNPVEGVVSFTGGRPAVPTYIGEILLEMSMNHDSYRNRPIVPPELQGLPVEQQYDEFTSEAARRVGDWFGVSPKKLDHLMRTGIGSDLVGGADYALRSRQGIDPEVEGYAQVLRDIQETQPASEVARLRRLVLEGLPLELRRRVEAEERRPEPRLPFADSMRRRFDRRLGGQTYKTGLEQALSKRGLSVGQWQQIREVLRSFSETQEGIHETEDTAFNKGQIDGEQYREFLKMKSFAYSAEMTGLGARYPRAREILTNSKIRQEFNNDIYTLANSAPDSRSQIEILLGAYRSIQIPSLTKKVIEGDFATSEDEDWAEYELRRAEFLSGLSPKLAREVQSLSEAGRTPLERELRRGREVYAVYWDLHRLKIKEVYGSDAPLRIAQYQRWLQLGGQERSDYALVNSWLGDLYREIQQDRQLMRESDPELDAFLYRWSYTNTLRHPENQGREGELRPSMQRLREGLPR